jgi:hypothetical protein
MYNNINVQEPKSSNKKQNNFFILLFLGLLIIGLSSYIIADKVMSTNRSNTESNESKNSGTDKDNSDDKNTEIENKEQETEEPKEIELDVNSKQIKDLMYVLQKDGSSSCSSSYFDEENKTAESIDNNIKLNMAFIYMYGVQDCPASVKEFTAAQMKEAMAKVFGSTTTYRDENFSSCTTAIYKYDIEKKIYKMEDGCGCGGMCTERTERKLYKAIQKEDTITIEEKIGYAMPDNNTDKFSLYNYYNHNERIGECIQQETYTCSNLDKYYSDLSSIIYTFKMENGNYVFEKSEIIK